MIKIKIAFIGLFLIISSTTVSYSANNAGSTTLAVTKISIGPRITAMGTAGVGIENDVVAMVYNPAALSTIKGYDVEAAHLEYISQVQYENVLAGMELPWKAGLGVAVNYINYGNFPRAYLETNEGFTYFYEDEQDNFIANTIYAIVGYGQKVSEMLAIGCNVKYINENIDSSVVTAILSDVGVLLKASKQLNLGLCYQNIGQKVGDYVVATDIRVGGCYKSGNDKFIVSAEYNIPSDSDGYISAGAEYNLTGNIIIRGGYNTGTVQGYSAGLGLIWEKWMLNYSYVPFSDFGQTHRAGLKYTW